jgi:hypothetical protein
LGDFLWPESKNSRIYYVSQNRPVYLLTSICVTWHSLAPKKALLPGQGGVFRHSGTGWVEQ